MSYLEENDFRNMVQYFWQEKGDPTRYSEWSEEMCLQLWPAFYHAWKQYEAARLVLSAVAESYR